jgi:glycosyltransferase involved in cell wall biosynthesis
MTEPNPSVLAIHPVIEGFRLNPVAGGKDLAAGVCTEVLLEMGCRVSVWPLDWSGESASEKFFSKHEIFWGDSGRIQMVPTCQAPDLQTYLNVMQAPAGPVPADIFCRPLDHVDQVLRDYRPRLIHVHQTQNPLVRVVKRLSPKTRVLLSNHSGVISSFVEDYDWIVVPSHWMRKGIVARHPHLAARVQVIPYFLQPEFLQEEAPAGEGEGIAFIGLLNDDRKGLDLLLVALTLLAKSGLSLPLHVIGEGKMLPAYKTIAKAGKLDATFYGKLSTRENRDRLRRSKLFVMPSRVENFPIVYLEALACGLPVIGYPPVVNELNQVLGEEVGSGFDAQKSNANELAGLIRTWYEHKGEAFAARRAAVQGRVRELFSLATHREAYRQLYAKLLTQ